MTSLAALVAAVVLLVLLERLRPGSASQRGEWANNGIVFLLGILGKFTVAPLFAVAESAVIRAAGGGLIDLAAWPLGLGAITWLVAMDLGEYLFHRAQHAFPWMWAMHSLHHSDRAMNVGTSQRHFWLEIALKTVSIWLAVALLFRASGQILAIYTVVSWWHLATHANVRLGFGRVSWLWNSPQYHRLHHSSDPAHFNANYAALLPIFDVLSGAYRRPAPGEYPDTGLDEAVSRPLDLIIWPLRGLWPPRGVFGGGPKGRSAPTAGVPVAGGTAAS